MFIYCQLICLYKAWYLFKDKVIIHRLLVIISYTPVTYLEYFLGYAHPHSKFSDGVMGNQQRDICKHWR